MESSDNLSRGHSHTSIVKTGRTGPWGSRSKTRRSSTGRHLPGTLPGLLRHTDLLERLDDGLASPTSTLPARSLGMICSASSFFPRGIACPPLVVTPPDYLSVIIPL